MGIKTSASRVGRHGPHVRVLDGQCLAECRPRHRRRCQSFDTLQIRPVAAGERVVVTWRFFQRIRMSFTSLPEYFTSP